MTYPNKGENAFSTPANIILALNFGRTNCCAKWRRYVRNYFAFQFFIILASYHFEKQDLILKSKTKVYFKIKFFFYKLVRKNGLKAKISKKSIWFKAY